MAKSRLVLDIGVDPWVGLHAHSPARHHCAFARRKNARASGGLKAPRCDPRARPSGSLDAEDGKRRPDRGEAERLGAGERLAEGQHREQELQRGRDILEEAERRIRQALGRGGEQQQRHRGDRAAEDQQRVGLRAERRRSRPGPMLEPQDDSRARAARGSRSRRQALERVDRRDLADEAVEAEAQRQRQADPQARRRAGGQHRHAERRRAAPRRAGRGSAAPSAAPPRAAR